MSDEGARELEDIHRAQVLDMQRSLDASFQTRKNILRNGEEIFVCFLDIEGFKQALDDDDEALYETYLRLVRAGETLFSGWIGQDGIEDPNCLLVPFRFSDSWIFGTVDTSDESFRQICHAGAALWLQTLDLRNTGIPSGPNLIARGAITKGRVWWDTGSQVIIGRPLAAAYVYSTAMQCFGVGEFQ
jgi:hypothetical protein